MWADVNGARLYWERHGSGEPLLWITGFTISSEVFRPILPLYDGHFDCVLYDNRGAGRSKSVPALTSMPQLAADAAGILDHLGIETAHVVGVSMGGMIAQTMAIDHQDRVLSLTSIMSSTGKRTSGFQHPSLLPQVLRRGARTREEYVESTLVFSKFIGSPDYPTTEETGRARAEETWDRGLSFSGVTRQMLAIVTQRDRTKALAELDIPVTVVHGLSDKMVHVSGGRATARAVPDAELVEVPGMGHDLPVGLFDVFVDAITRTANRAKNTD